MELLTETGSVGYKEWSRRAKVPTPSQHQYIKLSSLRDINATSQIQSQLNKEHKTPFSKSQILPKEDCQCLREQVTVSKPLHGKETRPKSLRGLQNTSISHWLDDQIKVSVFSLLAHLLEMTLGAWLNPRLHLWFWRSRSWSHFKSIWHWWI